MKVNTDNLSTICCVGGFPTEDNEAYAVVTFSDGVKATFRTHRLAEKAITRYEKGE
jgi:glutamate mutase epsilon subunit